MTTNPSPISNDNRQQNQKLTQRRKRMNLVVGASLLAVVALLFFVTLAKLGVAWA